MNWLFMRFITMKNCLLYILFAFIVSCNHQERNNKVSENQSVPELENSGKNNDETAKGQDSTNILGDKIILSNKTDENGLTSPDTIIVLRMFNDSGEINQINNINIEGLIVINTEKYFFKDKATKYILASRNLADSLKDKSCFKTKIYKIRPNNFVDDKNLPVQLLDSAYRNYDVTCFDKSENVYLVKPKMEYNNARMFVRLIKFNKDNIQENSITLNDFIFTSGKKTDNGYILGLNDFGHGVSYYFVNSHYSYKIVWLDKKLNFLGDFHVAQPSTELTSVGFDDKRCYASFELHGGCDICDWNFCFYDLYFNKKYKLVNLDVKKQPRDFKIDADTLLNHINKCKI